MMRLVMIFICFVFSIDGSAQFQEGFVNIENGRLFYQKQGTGPPLLFLHGLCLDHRMWNEQIRFFATQFTCITVDLRGFGKSSVPSALYSFHEDLKVLLDSLHVQEPVILVALSMGGKAAINFSLVYPERTKALILADVAIEGYNFKKFNLKPVFELARAKGIDSANQLFLNNAVFAYTKKNDTIFNRLKNMILSYTGWQWIHQNPIKPLSPVAAIQQLYRIKIPVLIITGEHDIRDFKKVAHILHKNIKHSKIRKIKNAGHLCNMENSKAFNDLVLNFLTANDH